MFSIFRSSQAVAPLQDTWERAGDTLREEILRATQRLDQQLCTDPQERGESRDGQARILFEAPLAAVFEVDEEKKLVRILRTWAFAAAGRWD